jgi:TatD-related deoxyribonuclease
MTQIILDNHLHLQLHGRNVEAIKDFERAGGTHIVLSHMEYCNVSVIKEKNFKRSYEITLKLAELVRKNTNVKVFATLGPYPVVLLKLVETMTLEEAKNIMFEGMDLAGKYIEEGKAIAIGEIGRPHFSVSEDIWTVSNDILRYGMEVAKERGCAVVLHTESATKRTFKELAEMADSVGLSREKVVKHYSPPIVDVNDNYGLFPSILSGKRPIQEAISQGARFLMETDYLDDPKRPGAVMGIKTVPKRTKAFLKNGIFNEEDVIKIHKENPEKVYGIEMEI